MRILEIFARRLAASLTFVLPKSETPWSESKAATAPLTPAALKFEQNDPDDAEYRAIAGHIAKLMMADEWVEISDQIAAWESDLVSTPGGLRFHEVSVEVALSGLQSLLDAVPHKALSDLADAEYELDCFIDTHRRSPDSHVLALLAARAHLMLGNACRADHWPKDLGTEAWRRMARHFMQAEALLEDYDARALMSPLVAEAQYLQARGAPGGKSKVAGLFERWIMLDPSNPRTYASHAQWLADPDNASQQTLLTLADEAIARTEETIGMGGYALFFQPLLSLSEDTRTFYDPDLYATAILDLATHSASQADVNRAADALAGEVETYGAKVPLALKDTLLMLVRNEIKICYPRLWTRPEEAIRSLIKEAADAIPGISFDDLSKAA